MEREDIRKTLTNENIEEKKTKEQISWKFSCDNQAIKEKWIGLIVGLSKHFQEEEEQIKKYFSTETGDSSQGFSLSRASVSNNPWRESAAMRKTLS